MESSAGSSSRWGSPGSWDWVRRGCWQVSVRPAPARRELRIEPGAPPRAKSMILVFLTGGLGHLDSFDMKPEAPEGIRGEFRPIETATPGMMLCEHLPEMAARSDRLAVVRSLAHPYNNHLNATHELLTGHSQPGAFFDKIASRDDYPCYAAGSSYARPRSDGLPAGVMLPTFLMEGPLIWPGQHAGFLGPSHDPWQIKEDPNKPDFRVESLTLPDGFSVERLEARKDLLSDAGRVSGSSSGRCRARAKRPVRPAERAGLFLAALGLGVEGVRSSARTRRSRDRYGRHVFGQSLLLARRLVAGGGADRAGRTWGGSRTGTRTDNFKRLKKDLLPPTRPRRLGAARRPATSRAARRDAGDRHRRVRPHARGSAPAGQRQRARRPRPLVAGASRPSSPAEACRAVRRSAQSDRIGAYPASSSVLPRPTSRRRSTALGIDLGTELIDKFNRPLQLCKGEPIPVFTSTAGA